MATVGAYAWDDHDAALRHDATKRTILKRISIDLHPNIIAALPWAVSFLDSYRKLHDPNDRYLNKMAIVVDIDVDSEGQEIVTAMSLIDGRWLNVYQYVEFQ